MHTANPNPEAQRYSTNSAVHWEDKFLCLIYAKNLEDKKIKEQRKQKNTRK